MTISKITLRHSLFFFLGLSIGMLANWRFQVPVYLLGPFFIFHFVLQTQSKKELFFCLWMIWAGTFFSTFEGMIPAFQSWFDLSVLTASVSHIVLSLLHVLPMVFFLTFWWDLKSRYKWAPLQSLSILSLMIYLGNLALPQLFPMLYAIPLGLSEIPIRQLFSLIGVEGTSLLIWLFNAYLYWLWLHRSEFNKSKIIKASSIIVFLILATYGLCLLEKSRWSKTDQSIRFAIIQSGIYEHGGMPLEMRLQKESEYLVHLESELNNFGAKLNSLDMIVLPEGQIFSHINTQRENTVKFKNLIQKFRIPVISGGNSKHFYGQPGFNSLFFLDKNSNIVDIYQKVELMPGGEFKPLQKSLPFLSNLLPGKNLYSFGASEDFALMTLNGLKFTGSICYEDILRKTHRVGSGESKLFLSVSSDYHFGKNYFHLNHASTVAARSLEERRPVIRSTIDGLSFVMNAQGQFLGMLKVDEKDRQIFELKFNSKSSRTFFSRIETVLPLIFSLFILFAPKLLGIRKNQHKN